MKLSDAEWELMNALWEQYPATARDIRERLPQDRDWAYTTIKTMLTRLVNKKAVSENKRGNTSVYEPLVTQSQARKTALHALFDKVLNGAPEPVLHFLIEEKKLSARDRKKLLDILNEMENKEGEPS